MAKEIVIDDLGRGAVKAAIAFLHTGEVDAEIVSSDEDVLDMLSFGHRYNVSSLIDMCLHPLASRLNVQTVAKLFHIADIIGNCKFRLVCLDFIRLHISEVQTTESC